MHAFSLAQIASALPNGRITAGGVSFTPPGHSERDRSGRVLLNPRMPFGIWVQPLAQDHELDLRDYVLGALGIGRDDWREAREPDPEAMRCREEARARHEREQRAEIEDRRQRACAMWEAARDPRGTIVATYLASRALNLPDEVAGTTLRFHPSCPWWDEDAGRMLFVPVMLASMRDVVTGEVVAVHRTALSPEGKKLGRKMFGPTRGAAVMLDAFDTITTGLAIGEGIESVLAARQMGIRPAWALGSIGAIASFPVLPGIETLTLLAENDPNGASERGCAQVGNRWCNAGRSVDLVRPDHGKDMNDELAGRTAA